MLHPLNGVRIITLHSIIPWNMIQLYWALVNANANMAFRLWKWSKPCGESESSVSTVSRHYLQLNFIFFISGKSITDVDNCNMPRQSNLMKNKMILNCFHVLHVKGSLPLNSFIVSTAHLHQLSSSYNPWSPTHFPIVISLFPIEKSQPP